MDTSLRDDVHVKTVAQVDRVDVVTARGDRISQVSVVSRMRRYFQSTDRNKANDQERLNRSIFIVRVTWNSPFEIAVHDGEEHLEEEVDGIDQYRQQVQPRFTRHDGQIINALE